MTFQSWRAVDLGASQIAEIRALFSDVFGQPMSEALWRWKYDDSRGLATGTRDEQGHLLAHYGGTARVLAINAQMVSAVQLGDVMVAMKARGILSRRGPFATAANAFLQRFVALPGRFSLGFGFPSERHARLGEKLGMYRTLGNVQELSWTCKVEIRARYFSIRTWEAVALDWGDSRTDDRIDRLWCEFRKDTGNFVVARRDANWWRHRFANHPNGSYRCWWIFSRFSNRLLGAVVLKPGVQPTDDWELLDFLGPIEGLGSLFQAARALAASSGATRLKGWFSDGVVSIVRNLDGGSNPSSQIACQYCITQRLVADLSVSVSSQPWWLTGGDTDFR